MAVGRKPEISLGLGLATATIVYAIYQKMPNSADMRVAKPGDEHLEAVRKQNAWMAAATVAGISLLAKDATIFIIGGATVIAFDWLHRVNAWTNPLSGRVDVNPFTVETPRAAPTENPDVAYGSLQAVN